MSEPGRFYGDPRGTFAEVRQIQPHNIQIGGDHYKTMKIQPIEFIMANDLGFCEGNAIKYICRYRLKGGAEDLRKAKHYIDLLLEKIHEQESIGKDSGTDWYAKQGRLPDGERGARVSAGSPEPGSVGPCCVEGSP